jgi:hypothetical protein
VYLDLYRLCSSIPEQTTTWRGDLIDLSAKMRYRLLPADEYRGAAMLSLVHRRSLPSCDVVLNALGVSWAALNSKTSKATSYTSETSRLDEPVRQPEKCTQLCIDYGLTKAHLRPP